MKFPHVNSNIKIKWKLELDWPVIVENCDERGWVWVDEEDPDFNFFWAKVTTIK